MRGTTLALVAMVTTAAALCGLYACSGDDTQAASDAGADQTADTNVGPAPGCVVSPTPAPFPTGQCNVPQPAQPDSFDEALGKVGLDRCSMQQDPSKMVDAVMAVLDKRQMPDFRPLLQYPLRLPAYGAETAKWLDDAMAGKTPVASAIAAAAARRGAPVTDCADPAWSVVDGEDQAPLATTLGEMASAFGADFDHDATAQATAGLPIDLRRALVPVMRAMTQASQDIAAARAPAEGKFAALFKLAPDWIIGTYSYNWSTGLLPAFDAVDVNAITRASLYVASTVESADLARFRGATFDPVEVDTPLGSLVIHGAGKDDYEPGSAAEKAFFLLDTGGDDTYRVPVGSASYDHSLSVSVDLAGKDTYGYVEKADPADNVGHRLPSDGAGRQQGLTRSRVARQGGALLGVGLLWDLGTDDDTYQSLAVSQGTGVFGVGVLYDEGGNDSYKSEALSQGAAGFGIGLLLDGAGNDHYLVYAASEGFGFTQGVGALVDESGDDTYYSDPGDPAVGGDAIYANAQLPGVGNTSMTQGCGEGHRPDAPEPGYQFAGGMGILRDAAGNDSYTTSVFGQGCSFAMGIGLFLEGGGDDTYEGLWYVQGSAAHTGVVYFWDHAGNDEYDPTFPIRATSIGVGHDYSSVIHYDEGGDDAYHGPGLSMGCGNANGVGLLVNVGGTDTFSAPNQNSLGCANSTEVFKTPRKSIQTLGVFVKAGGSATYTVGGIDAGSYPGGEWSYTPNNTPLDAGLDGPFYEYEKSIGIDRPDGSATLP